MAQIILRPGRSQPHFTLTVSSLEARGRLLTPLSPG
jgi:hypothetical protein